MNRISSIDDITRSYFFIPFLLRRLYFAFEENEYSKIFDNEDFGFYQITVHQPEKDEKGNIVKDAKGKPKSDSSLKDIENVPMKESIEKYKYSINSWAKENSAYVKPEYRTSFFDPSTNNSK